MKLIFPGTRLRTKVWKSDEQRHGTALGIPLLVAESAWVPVLWDGEFVPTFDLLDDVEVFE